MFKKKKQSGFIALTSVLLFGALILVMGLSMASTSISEQAMTGYEKGGEKAVSAANACVDLGVSRVKSGEASYDTTTTEVNLYDDVYCNLSFSEDPEHSYRVKVTGTASVDTSQRSFSHTEYAYVDNHEFIPDLVGYWPMDENRGYGVYNEALDDRESYLEFDGVDDYVDCGNDASLDITDAITIEAWVKTNTITGGYDTIVHKGIPGPDRYALFLHNDEVVGILSNVDSVASINANLVVGNWYHIVWTFEDSSDESKIYVNGVLNNEVVETKHISSTITKHLHIGSCEEGYINYFNGLIDDVRIYNRALSGSEVQEHYQGIHKDETGLVGHWEMDETFGNLAVDSSGNNNHGTIYGAKSGGSKGRYVGIEAFTTVGSHTWTVPEGVTEADVLVVGGGGGGGSNYGGGGGAGGLIFEEGYGVSGDISVKVGGGGIGSATTSTAATNGGNSSFGSLTAIGGGKGGNGAQTTTALGSGGDGGSGGGGGGHLDSYSNILGGAGTTNQGNKGGNGDSGSTTTELSGGGGGGASQAGFNGVPQQGGAGGSGLYLGDVFGTNYGENGWFAGGGGGGAGEVGSGGLGGIGGGGDGGYDVAGGNASANTGGGGGAGGVELAGGDGGSGIVIIRYTRWVDGRHDKALEFDGIRNYVDAGGVDGLGSSESHDPHSILFWVKLGSISGAPNIIHIGPNSGGKNSAFEKTSNGWNWYFYGNDVCYPEISLNQWVFVALVYDGSDYGSPDSRNVYYDGIKQTHVQDLSDPNNALDLNENPQLYIGADYARGRYLDGQIDDVRIYNRALTADEIKFLYQRGVESHVNR